MTALPYLHILDGRMRLKVPEIKRSTTHAAQLEEALHKLHGVRHVKANALTGNVLVFFDSSIIDAPSIVQCIRAMGYLRIQNPPSISHVDSVTDVMVRSMTEVLVQHAISAML